MIDFYIGNEFVDLGFVFLGNYLVDDEYFNT